MGAEFELYITLLDVSEWISFYWLELKNGNFKHSSAVGLKIGSFCNIYFKSNFNYNNIIYNSILW